MNKIQEFIEKSLSEYFLITNTETGNNHVFTRYGAIMTACKYGNNYYIAITECQENGSLL